MITTLDAVDIVYQRLSVSPIKAAITGGIYKKRPLNSQKEDVIINALPFNALQVQEGFINVNVYVPNLVITIDGVQDFTQPNTSRLQALANMAVGVLTDEWAQDGDINYAIQQQSLFEEDDSKSHYVNFRLQFYAVNL